MHMNIAVHGRAVQFTALAVLTAYTAKLSAPDHQSTAFVKSSVRIMTDFGRFFFE